MRWKDKVEDVPVWRHEHDNWFAWYPVKTVTDTKVWWETVERTKVILFGNVTRYHYKEKD